MTQKRNGFGAGAGLEIAVVGCLAWLLALASASAAAQQRVISTDASITAVILELGAGERLVGVDVTSQLPKDYASLARVGYHRALSAEGLLSLNPDLVLTSEHAGPAVVLDKIATLDVTVTRLPAPLTTKQLDRNIAVVASALGHETQGEALREHLKRKSQALQAVKLPAPRTVLLRERDGALRVAGNGTAGDALVGLIGGANAANFDGYRSFSEEALLALNPELLLVAVPSKEKSSNADAWLERFKLLRYGDAARAGRVQLVSAEALIGGVSLSALSEADALLERLQVTGEFGP